MKSPKPRLLSGIKPTGRIHIGNYFGALKQFVDLQDSHDTFVFVANLHALTGLPSKDSMIEDTHNLVLDYLGAGLDPAKVTLFKQSDVPAHANIAWVFNNFVSVSYLMRAHAFKDAEAKKSDVNVGTFDYPVLMAADILIYDTDVVPVGKDQKQHVEYARDIAGKFNNQYGEHFKMPNEMILEAVEVIPGTDGQKMSKSYNNTIPLFATDEEIKKAVMSITTDSRGPEEEKNPDELIIYQIHKFFNPSPELKAQYAKGLGYGDAKKKLIDDIITFVTPMRERRAHFEKNPKLVQEILVNGALKANDIAMKKMFDVYEALGLTE
ncbi:MAG TPA: tryptophan--tRNA ligase [Candidatus Paceibacterota bacterium]|jgi:tryptophanyl-tRNA synthetase|nr:tryptophan--tRNA ligase [Candidatus Paceibacterota bacterium]